MRFPFPSPPKAAVRPNHTPRRDAGPPNIRATPGIVTTVDGHVHRVDTNSAAFKIFNQIFPVRMPVMQVRSIEDIQQYGVVASGDRRYDEAMRAERRMYYQTIAQLVMHHQKAVPIQLINVKDAVVIYRLVQQHLEDWAAALKFSFNVRADQETLDDLLAMDAFAQAVYPKAQEQSEKTAHFDEFARGFLGMTVKPKNSLGLSLPTRGRDALVAASQQPVATIRQGGLGSHAAQAHRATGVATDTSPFAHLRTPGYSAGTPGASVAVGPAGQASPGPGNGPAIPPRPSLEAIFKQRKIQYDPIFHRKDEP